jgi:pilus assembly protein CpaE
MAEKIKVLIVDDNENTRDGTQRLLEMEDTIEIVGFAENGAIAIERARELQPYVVLMDINMPVMNGIEATARLRDEVPLCKVIIVSVQDDTNYTKEGFKAGAVDFVSKPITSAGLMDAISGAYRAYLKDKDAAAASQQVQQQAPVQQTAPPPGWGGAPMASSEGHIIGVLGFKGGMGKTTIAANLAIGLVQSGKQVVLVDGNTLFGDVAVSLNVRGQHTVVDAAHLASDPNGIDAGALGAIIQSHESGLKVLIAPANPRESELVAAETFVNLLTFLKTMFEYVIVDTSNGYDEIFMATVQASDRLIVLTTATMPALKDAKITLNELVQFDFNVENAMLVLNQVDRNSSITAEQIAGFLKMQIMAQIPVDPSAVEAINKGAPLITLDAKRAPSVQPLQMLVQGVRASLEAQAAPEAGQEQKSKSGWFSR